MGDIEDIVEAIEARMVAMNFVQTDEVFNFDEVPTSVIDLAFRMETVLTDNPYFSENVGNPKEAISIWIAYKTKRDPRAVWKTAMNNRETIEVDLINHASITGLSTDPLLTLDREASIAKYLDNYLVSLLVFTANYIRDISPS